MTVAAPPRPDLSPEARLARRQRRIARGIGLVVMLAGALNIASAFTPALRDRISLVDAAFDGSVSDLAAGATALLWIALVLVGRGLTHRRRAAYRAALGLLALSFVTHLAKGLDVEEAVAVVLVGALLWRSRRVFGEQVPRVRATSVLRWAPRLLIITFAYGIVGLVLRRSQVSPDLTPWLAVREVVARMFGFSGPLTISGSFGTWFPASLTLLGISALVALVLLARAPVADRFVVHDEERTRVRDLVDRADGDTLDPFALRHDKRYVFAADGRAAVAYRYVNGVGLAAGDPVGDRGSAPDAVRRFLARCDAHGWRPAAISVRGDRLDVWLEQGMRVQYLGDEAIIDVRAFHLEGRPMRPVRQAVSRTRRHGITTEVHREGALDPTLRRALLGISEVHLDGHPDRGFSMALDGLLSGRDADCAIVVARDDTGAPCAFQRYVPCRGGRGLSLDAMRRDDSGAPHVNGVNELLIVDAVAWAAEQGIEEVSLNFAAFKGLMEEDPDRGLRDSVTAWFVRRLDPHFQIGSLLSFNAKFHPRWVPRYLVYRAAGDFAPVGLAAASAEGFVPLERRPAAAS
ncbi:MAG: bifunctional lysylphosphatidylglycerol flippase/synthetase MprF [Actinomycetes bacterium]